MESRIVTIETINEGAILDLWGEGFKKLLANVADENTQPDKVRTLTITLKVKPDKKRSKADTQVEVKTNLAPMRPHESYVVFSTDGDQPLAFAPAPEKQEEFEDMNNITPLRAAGGEK